MPELYHDRQGKVFRPAGRCPYSELVAGNPFAFDGDSKVYLRGYSAAAGLTQTHIAKIYYQIVTLLEPAARNDLAAAHSGAVFPVPSHER
jgi:hypothetical protein